MFTAANLKKYSFELLVIIILIVMYLAYIPEWVSKWLNFDSFYAFGLFMLVFILYLIKTNWNAYQQVQKRFCGWGILPLIAGFLLYFIGIKANYVYMVNLSFPVFIAGIILTVYGWNFLKSIALPLGLFLFTLPVLPLHRITLPFQLFSAETVTNILGFLGINSFNEGNIIFVEQHRLSIIPGCSGLKSLYSLFFICVMYAYFLSISIKKKIAFIVFSLPLAVSINILRILFVSFYVLYNGTAHAEEVHDTAGIAGYILSISILILLAKLLETSNEPVSQ